MNQTEGWIKVIRETKTKELRDVPAPKPKPKPRPSRRLRVWCAECGVPVSMQWNCTRRCWEAVPCRCREVAL
jgi:hypothetical protein